MHNVYLHLERSAIATLKYMDMIVHVEDTQWESGHVFVLLANQENITWRTALWCIQSDKLNHVITDVLHEIGIAVNSYISMVIYKIIFEKNSILKICIDEFFFVSFWLMPYLHTCVVLDNSPSLSSRSVWCS